MAGGQGTDKRQWQRVTIKEVAEIIAKNAGKIKWLKTNQWVTKRIMSTERAESYGIKAKVNVNEGINETMRWYKENKDKQDIRYNSFIESA